MHTTLQLQCLDPVDHIRSDLVAESLHASDIGRSVPYVSDDIITFELVNYILRVSCSIHEIHFDIYNERQLIHLHSDILTQSFIKS